MFIDDQPTVTADPGTRARVLGVVTEHGPVASRDIAERLGITQTAVRRHLDALADRGAITEHEPAASVPRGRGRPARTWVVAQAGHDVLPSAYDALAEAALAYLARQHGPDAVESCARERIAALEEQVADDLATVGPDPGARIEALVAALTREGYAASARPVGAGTLVGVQLCQGHCPVGQVAGRFPQLCDAETDAFSRLLGVHVQRLATLAHGDHVCTTYVPVSPLTERSAP